MRQVDDIAVAATSKNIASQVIKDIGSYMSVPIKEEGLVQLFNGINVTQGQDNIKIHVTSYLERVLECHKDWLQHYPTNNEPLPMKSDKDTARELESAQPAMTADGKIDENAIKQLEQEYGFQYRPIFFCFLQKVIPSSLVSRRYRRRCFAASKCARAGLLLYWQSLTVAKLISGLAVTIAKIISPVMNLYWKPYSCSSCFMVFSQFFRLQS